MERVASSLNSANLERPHRKGARHIPSSRSCMPVPPALKREIVIVNFAGGRWSQGLKEGPEHAADCAITDNRTPTPSTYPTSNSDD